MSMIIDELISLLGFKVDEASASQAKNALGGVEAAANKLAGVLGAAGLAAGFVKLVEYGHAASETMERLDTLFGASAAEVVSWSDAFGKEVGRSRKDLQQMTAGVGAMVAPMGISGTAAAEMGERLAELAVNLAELNDAEDKSTMDALRMALTGNVRALKQYGLVIDEADLKEAARQLGITKGIKTLSEAERAQVSYQAVLNKSANVAKAGLDPTEAWEARIQNLRDTIGLKLLPIAERMADVAIKVIDFFEKLAKNTALVEVAFAMLAPVAAAAGWSLIAPFLPAIGMFTALALIIEDIVTLFQGGDSVLGRFLDKVGGEGTSIAFVEEVKKGVLEFKRVLQEDVLPVVVVVFTEIKKWLDILLVELPRFGRALGDHLFDVVQKVSGWLDSISKSLAEIVKFSESFGTKGLGEGAIKAGKGVGSVSTAVGETAVEAASGASNSVFKPVGDAVVGALSWLGSAFTDSWKDEASKVAVRVSNGTGGEGNGGQQVTAPINVTNNFNGVKPDEVDGRVRDAANSTGQHIGRQLRDAAAGMSR